MILSLMLALAPIAMLITLGALLRRKNFLAEDFWPQAERLCYYILLPSLFLHVLATARLDEIRVAGLACTLVLSNLAVAGCVFASRKFMAVDGAAFTSIFQGSVRFNNYVAITAAMGMFGTQGAALSAIANAAITPTVNVLSILAFVCCGKACALSLPGVLRLLAANPLIVSCAAGIALQAAGCGLSPVIGAVLKALGLASLPLGLMCVGAALDFSSLRSWLRPLGASSAAKFALMPLAALACCRLFGLEGNTAVAAILFLSLPTGSSSYILARQLGGDAALMAGIIAGQTLLAGMTVPLAVGLLSALV